MGDVTVGQVPGGTADSCLLVVNIPMDERDMLPIWPIITTSTKTHPGRRSGEVPSSSRQQLNTGIPTLCVKGGKFMKATGRN